MLDDRSMTWTDEIFADSELQNFLKKSTIFAFHPRQLAHHVYVNAHMLAEVKYLSIFNHFYLKNCRNTNATFGQSKRILTIIALHWQRQTIRKTIAYSLAGRKRLHEQLTIGLNEKENSMHFLQPNALQQMELKSKKFGYFLWFCNNLKHFLCSQLWGMVQKWFCWNQLSDRRRLRQSSK